MDTKNQEARRRFLRGMAAGGVGVASSIGLAACGGSSGHDETVDFTHGIASGDPLQDRIIIWTRAVPDSAAGAVDIEWEVAADEAFTTLVRQGVATAAFERDYTVKVDVDGLTPGTAYWYRFRRGDRISATGIMRTLPTGHVEQARLAVFSCANYPAGYFHVYAEAARRGDFDVVVHLGDYIYEYGVGEYASGRAKEMGREVDPPHEIVTLDDYRRRYAQYRSDPDLQALHAAVPMIAVWDDHEIANNAWTDGAENHQPEKEGDYQLRKAAAVRAYHEWLPTRIAQPADAIFRGFDFGDLLSLHMLDTRILARDEQLSYTDYFGMVLGQPDMAAGLQQFLAKFAQDIASPQRQLLGDTQTRWLQARMAASSATWQILGQQVLMAPVHIPLPVLLGLLSSAGELGDIQLPPSLVVDPLTYVQLLQRQMAGDLTLTPQEQALLALPCLPYNLDSWDGYWAARTTVLQMARALDKNLVVLAGDTHNAWASELRDLDGTPIGVELATSSVSSPGFEEYLGAGIPPEQLAALLTGLANLSTLPAGRNWAGALKYADTSRRGYLMVTITPEQVRGDWYYVDTVHARSYTPVLGHSLVTLPGAGNRTLVSA